MQDVRAQRATQQAVDATLGVIGFGIGAGMLGGYRPSGPSSGPYPSRPSSGPYTGRRY